jgi:hypothetical protein
MSFWNTDLGKIQSHVIHDANGGISSINACVRLLQRELAKDNPDLNDIKKWTNAIPSAVKRVNEALDYGYRKTEAYTKIEK